MRIDWARDDHAVAVVDGTGRQAQRFTVEHSAVGLRGLLRRLDELGVGEVAIERPDGPVVDQLLQAGMTVVVIGPNQLKNLRGRYGERPLGIITRLENRVSELPKTRAEIEDRIRRLTSEANRAQAELDQPFAHAAA